MSEVLERPKAEDKKARQLTPQRIGLAEHRRQDYVVDAEEGTDVSELLDPAYWAHCSAGFQQFDRVEVRMETGEWIAELVVLQAGRNWAQMFLIAKHDLVKAAAAPVPASKYRVEWKGPARKHVVIRSLDSQVLQEGFTTKVEAEQWCINHEKAA
jgi:hypothetical protein